MYSYDELNTVSPGPAPSYGDGESEGPEWSGEWVNADNPGDITGPAPNAGDGISDGPGW